MDRMLSIELALKNESTERSFYLMEANRSKNDLAKSMFLQLAKDEEEHMNRIRELHETLLKDGKWPRDVAINVAGTNIRNVLDNLTSKAVSPTSHDDNDISALKKAIDFEAKGMDLYSKLSKLCDNQMERNFFEFLATIEKEHHHSLVDTLSYLENPEEWMMHHEHAGLDGA